MKVKIVQIAKGYNPDGDDTTEYLDDKGRIWYQVCHWEEGAVAVDQGVEHTREYVTEWLQLELPEEPTA